MMSRDDKIDLLVKERRKYLCEILVPVCCLFFMVCIGCNVDGFHWPVLLIWAFWLPGVMGNVFSFISVRRELLQIGIC